MKLILIDNDRIRIIADSAISRNGLPWFMPDAGHNWTWKTARAFRICKLGKNIAPKFANRYFDAETLLWLAHADDFDALDFMDGAVVCGNWMPLSDNASIPAELLARLSEYTTVKNGDIIAITSSDSPLPISLNQHISIPLNNTEVLSFNIK